MGIMSHLAASCMVSTLVPATHSLGCGFCSGFGQTVVGWLTFTNSPSYVKDSSCVHAFTMTSSDSRKICRESGRSMSKRDISWGW